MMLNRVLHEIEGARGTLRLSELGARLGIEESALVGMLEFWRGKGKLRIEGENGESGAICSGHCAGSCQGPAACSLLVRLPKIYELTINIDDL